MECDGVITMPQVVHCPMCRTQYQIKDELAGRKAKCKKCSQSFQIPALKRPAEESPEPAEPERTQCPHCAAWVAPELQFCSECRLNMHKNYGSEASDREREIRKNALYSLIGIGAMLVTTPVFFLMATLVVGGALAMLLSALLLMIGVSMGSFLLACQLFKQEPPEPGEILVIVIFSNLPAGLLAPWLFGGGVVGALGTVVIATVIAALMCMFRAGMPVVPSMLISVAYNVFSGILTVVWIVLLMLVFAGYMAATRPASPPDGPPATQSRLWRPDPKACRLATHVGCRVLAIAPAVG